MTLPPGEDVKEPVYGAPARWIAPDTREEASLQGLTVVAPSEVLATHLLEVLKRNLARLLTLKALQRQLDAFVTLSDSARGSENRRLLDELVPDKVPLDLLHTILRLLLEEQVSIRNLPLILEAIAEMRGTKSPPEVICEHVRQRLRLPVDRRVETRRWNAAADPVVGRLGRDLPAPPDRRRCGPAEIALPPEEFNALARSVADKVAAASEKGTYAGIVTTALRRRFLRTVLHARGIPNPVLSFEEIGIEARPALVGLAAP